MKKVLWLLHNSNLKKKSLLKTIRLRGFNKYDLKCFRKQLCQNVGELCREVKKIKWGHISIWRLRSHFLRLDTTCSWATDIMRAEQVFTNLVSFTPTSSPVVASVPCRTFERLVLKNDEEYKAESMRVAQFPSTSFRQLVIETLQVSLEQLNQFKVKLFLLTLCFLHFMEKFSSRSTHSAGTRTEQESEDAALIHPKGSTAHTCKFRIRGSGGVHLTKQPFPHRRAHMNSDTLHPLWVNSTLCFNRYSVYFRHQIKGPLADQNNISFISMQNYLHLKGPVHQKQICSFVPLVMLSQFWFYLNRVWDYCSPALDCGGSRDLRNVMSFLGLSSNSSYH